MEPDSGGGLRRIKIADIIIRQDVIHRGVNTAAVAELVRGFSVVGMITPIRVRPTRRYFSGVLQDAWELIAGRHRMEAAKLSGWSDIDANVVDMDDDHAELAMLTENLERTDLTPAEESYAVARSKELYIKLNPETANGGDRKSDRNNCELKSGPAADRFTKTVAKATGKSERAVQMVASAGENVDRILRTVGTSLDKRTELDALKSLPKDEQEVLISRAQSGEKVSAKAALRSAPAKAPTVIEMVRGAEAHEEEAYQAAFAAVSKLSPESRERIRLAFF